MDPYRDPQLQVGKNNSYLFKLYLTYYIFIIFNQYYQPLNMFFFQSVLSTFKYVLLNFYVTSWIYMFSMYSEPEHPLGGTLYKC